MIGEHLAQARSDLGAKSKALIDAETAAVWGARAIVAFERYRDTGDLAWYRDAVEYKHEALEHAAGGPPGTLERLQTEMQQAIQAVFR